MPEEPTTPDPSELGLRLTDALNARDIDAIQLEEVRQVGIGVVFFVQRHRGRPAASSGFAAQRIGSVITWADGFVERFATFTNIDQARATAERLAQERG
jgi:hypothetical protein